MSTAEIAEGAGAALLIGAGVMAYGARAPWSTLLAPSVHHGVRTRRAVALTFDDGPSEATPKLLRALEEWGVRATFFQIGVNARRLASIARETAAAGHAIGNHSEEHTLLSMKRASFIYRQLAAAQDSIERASGVRPRWFRPPFGVRWFGLRAAQHSLGLSSVLWSTIGKDWKWPADRVVVRLLRGANNGAIFCLHDGRELERRPDISATIEAVRRLAPALLERGFHFETMNEILCPTTI